MNLNSRLHGMFLVMLGCFMTITIQYIMQGAVNNFHMKIMAAVGNASSGSTNRRTTVLSTTTVKTPPKSNSTNIYRWNVTGWIKWDNFCRASLQLDSALLRTPPGVLKIFIHDLKVDKWVSGEIKKHGVWEPNIMSLIHHYMSVDKDLNLLDIGSHIGQFSLMAAKMGRKAVAVDPLLENVVRLCKSIELNKFVESVDVFYVALSNSRKQVSFLREAGNVGGTKVHAVASPVKNTFNPNIIDTVLLDDLLPLIQFRKAFMKMDVESHENSVLKGGYRFFATMNIPFVLMEWFQHVNNPTSALEIINFMNMYNYTAYHPRIGSAILSKDNFVKWPTNVLWKKSNILI